MIIDELILPFLNLMTTPMLECLALFGVAVLISCIVYMIIY